MPPYTLTINDRQHAVDAEPDMPLLWVLRDLVGLTGTKFGCGLRQCGACTVQVNGAAVRSCRLPVANVADASTRTIEAERDPVLHACRTAWLAEDVAQCGYCQAGMLMTASALLRANPTPTDEQIDDTLGANICRCGTYPRLRTAVQHAARLVRNEMSTDAPTREEA